MNSFNVGDAVIISEQVVPEEWNRTGKISEVLGATVVVILDNGVKQEVVTDDVELLHYSAWITTDPSAVADFYDVAVIRDELVGDDPVWYSTGPEMFYAETSVPVHGDTSGLEEEAKDLLTTAGWRIVGDWKNVSTGAFVTVERY